MKLGIHVKTDRHLAQVIGIVKAATSKGHDVMIFTMAGGERLLENRDYTDLHKNPGVKMSYCDHNAAHMGINKELIPAGIACGSQFDNALMVSDADRLIVL